jgi:hypothetical protein
VNFRKSKKKITVVRFQQFVLIKQFLAQFKSTLEENCERVRSLSELKKFQKTLFLLTNWNSMQLGKSENPERAQSVQGETQLKFKWNLTKFWDDRAQERLQREEFERKFEESKMSLDQLKVDVEKRD